MSSMTRLAGLTALAALAMAAPAGADTFAVDRSDDADVSACTVAIDAAGDHSTRTLALTIR
jgi:hypothetical protein